MATMRSVLFLFTTTIAWSDAAVTYCRCGYGGLCLSGEFLPMPCNEHLCFAVTGKFYEADCNTIANHCSSSPCIKGTCVPTFGSYFCKCPRGYVGQNCEFSRLDLALLGINSNVYLFYQVQSGPKGERVDFHLIYDPGEQENINSFTATGVKVVITVNDGRIFYPTIEGEFVPVDVKEKCENEALTNPDWQDIKVCNFLPSGEVLTFVFRSKFDSMQRWLGTTVQHIHYPYYTLGVSSYVNVKVLYVNNGQTELTLYDEYYLLFTYTRSRIPNTCRVTIDFDGCSSIPTLPARVLRARELRVDPIADLTVGVCKGTKRYSSSWYLQVNVDGIATTYDAQPTHLKDAENSERLILRSNYLPEGKHMIEYRLVFQGEPPHYGSLSTFEVYGRCWLEVYLGPMAIRVNGGRTITASCYEPLDLSFVLSNKAYRFSEMSFAFQCDHPEDPECAPIETDVPNIKKMNTPCGTTYTFEGYAMHTLTTVNKEKFKFVVIFAKTDIRLSLECLFNCFPIDPSQRVVMLAITDPYASTSINWTVEVLGQIIADKERDVDAFFPLQTTRILRVDGQVLNLGKEEMNEVSIKAKSNTLQLMVESTTQIINLEEYANAFTPVAVSGGTMMFNSTHDVWFTNWPVTFMVLQTSESLRDSLILVETHYRSEIIFDPHWTIVQLCITDAMNVEACSTKHVIEVGPPKMTTTQQGQIALESGSVKRFLHYIANTMYQHIARPYPEKFLWSQPPSARMEMLSNILRYTVWSQRDVMTITHILSMVFYSSEGNANEQLVAFDDEFNYFREYSDFLGWVVLKKLSLKILNRISDWTYQYSSKAGAKIRKTLYGDLLDSLFRCWSLAHIQGTLRDQWIIDSFKDSTYRESLLGSVDLIHNQMDIKLAKVLYSYCRALSTFAPLFYGIRDIGTKHARSWSLRSTYKGIQQSFNKTEKREAALGITDYIFGPVHPDSKWVQYASIELPDDDLLAGKELSIVVTLVNNRPDDTSVSPMLYIYVSTTDGEIIDHLPDFADFNVTLPVMIQGKYGGIQPGRDFNEMITSYLNPAKKLNSMNVYKIVLPSAFKTWTLEICTIENVPLKVFISHYRLPIYDEVDQEEARHGKWTNQSYSFHEDDSHPHLNYPRGFYCVEVFINPQPGEEQLPLYFYAGMLLAQIALTDYSVMFVIRSGVNLCEMLDPQQRNPRKYCEGQVKNREGRARYIDCICNEFGFISGMAKMSRITRIMMSEIGFTLPEGFNYRRHIVTIIAVILTVIVFLIALVRDLFRRKRSTLVNIDDRHPYDKIPLLIGVYTGMEFMSGTRARIAIKVEGLSSSSRVHLLKTKSKNKLKTATDEWFLLMTNQPLGKITSVTLWSDFYQLSSWYCRKIMLFDLKQGTWYMASVQRWFRVYSLDKESRVGTFKTFRLSPVDVKLKALPNKFREHLVTELRNSHHVVSLFCLHDRNLYTHEQRSLVIILKLFSIFFLAWFLPEMIYPLLFELPEGYSGGLSPHIGMGVDVYVFLTCLLIVVFSYILLSPVYLLIKSANLSHLVQRKVTNPVYQETVAPPVQIEMQKGYNLKHTQSITSVTHADTSRGVAFHFESTSEANRQSRFQSQYEQSQSVISRPGELNPSAHKIRKLRGKPHTQPWWRNFYRFAFGPCQFRCVNVTRRNLRLKMQQRMIAIRLTSLSLVLICLATMYWFEEYTNYWGKYLIHLYICSLAIVLDIFIVDPLLILLNSIIICFFVKTSNRELYLWNDDTRVVMPESLTLIDYLTSATRASYKPMTTAELKKKNDWLTVFRFIELLAFVFYLIIMLTICGMLLVHKHDRDYHNTIETLTLLYESGYNYVTNQEFNIDEMIRGELVEPYLTSTFLFLKDSWPGGKWIAGSKKRWGLDRVSRPVGGTSMYFTFIANTKTSRLPGAFTPYFDQPVGYLSDEVIQKEPVVLAREALEYTDHGIRLHISGKSSASYSLVGQQAIIPLDEWVEYYVQIGSILGEIVDKNSTVETLRVLILSINFYNGFASRINTIDVIIEFLPSGLLSAKVHVFSFKFSGDLHTTTNILRISLMTLIVGYFVYVALQHSRWGLHTYVRELSGYSDIALLLLGIVVCIGFFTSELPKYPVADELFHAPAEKYVDLHEVHYWDDWDSLYLSTFFLFCCLELCFIALSVIGSRALMRAMRNSFVVATLVWLMTIIYSRISELCSHFTTYQGPFTPYVNIYFRVIMPISAHPVAYPEFLFIIAIVAILSSKFCAALFIYHFDQEVKTLGLKNLDRARNLFEMVLQRVKGINKDEEEKVAQIDTWSFTARMLRNPTPQEEQITDRKMSIRSAKLNKKFNYLKSLWM